MLIRGITLSCSLIQFNLMNVEVVMNVRDERPKDIIKKVFYKIIT